MNGETEISGTKRDEQSNNINGQRTNGDRDNSKEGVKLSDSTKRGFISPSFSGFYDFSSFSTWCIK